MPDSMIIVASIVRRLRVDLERPDPFWPAHLAALVSIVLRVTLPSRFPPVTHEVP